MRDFLYDLKRTLTGKFTIIMIALIVIFTAGIAFAAVSTSSSSATPPGSEAYLLPAAFDSNGTYKVVDYAVNGYGQPVQGLRIVSYLTNVSSQNEGAGTSSIRYVNGTTDSRGYFNLSFTSSREFQYYYYNNEYLDGINVSSNEMAISSASLFLALTSDGFSESQNSTSWLLVVANQSNRVENNILFHYVSENNTPLSAQGIYYNVTSVTGYTFPSPERHMTYYRTISDVNNAIITLPLNRSANGRSIEVELFNSTGHLTVGIVAPLYSTVSASSFIEGVLQIPYEFLIPILGIFSAYFYYGKDKASGVLESIITRPVTKGRVMVSRFTGGAMSFLAGLLIALALSDLIVLKYTGSALSNSSFFSILVGYTIEAVGFSGIIYLVSQFVRSQGGILGIGIGLFFVMSLFWNDLMDVLLFETHVNLAVKSGLVVSIILDSISPSYYPTLIFTYHEGYLSSILGFVGQGVTAASLGITLASVTAVGIVWVVVPALASFFLARSRD